MYAHYVKVVRKVPQLNIKLTVLHTLMLILTELHFFIGDYDMFLQTGVL